MSSAAPTKRRRQPNTLPPGHGLWPWLRPVLDSTTGTKYLVAATGLLLTGFTVGHLAGNLNVFAGQDAINGYAKFLEDLGPALWLTRAGLLAAFVLHVYLGVTLKRRSRAARPVPYACEATVQASWRSRHMLLTGVVVGVFLLFHLAHYTFGAVNTYPVRLSDGTVTNVNYLDLRDAAGRRDVYSMVAYGFQHTGISVLYVVAQLFLLLHVSHGASSAFQSLGANTPRLQPTVRLLGWAVAFVVAVGNIVIVAAVWAGAVKPLPDVTRTLGAALARSVMYVAPGH